MYSFLPLPNVLDTLIVPRIISSVILQWGHQFALNWTKIFLLPRQSQGSLLCVLFSWCAVCYYVRKEGTIHLPLEGRDTAPQFLTNWPGQLNSALNICSQLTHERTDRCINTLTFVYLLGKRAFMLLSSPEESGCLNSPDQCLFFS